MKTCIDCGVSFTATGRNHKRCISCADKETKRYIRQWRLDNVVTGQGSGSSTGLAEANHMYKHGRSTFRRWAKERLASLNNCCERCGNSIKTSLKGTWAGHHKDHDKTNNVQGNLEVLCKRCHQLEHQCWLALKGVTTIPKGSTQETVEAPSSKQLDDKIVCSA